MMGWNSCYSKLISSMSLHWSRCQKQKRESSQFLLLCVHHLLPPVEFTMTDYRQWKESGEKWTSSPFYTHPQGYKLHLKIIMRSSGCGKGVHVKTVTIYSTPLLPKTPT